MIKKHLSLIAAVVALCLLTACSGKTAEVRNDVAVSDISSAVSAALSADALVSVPETYFAGFMKMDVSDYDGYDVKINSKGINIDEFGVFKAKDSTQLATIQKAVADYIQLRKDTWMVEYMPEERPKLDSAEVKTIGNYVMYAILSDDGKKSAFKEFEKSLKA